MTKICTKCKEDKGFENFHNSKKGDKYGLHSHCKDCRRLDRRKSYKDNPEKYAAWNRAWNLNNPEKRKSYDLSRDKTARYRQHRAYISANPEKKSAYDRNYKHSRRYNGGKLTVETQNLLFMLFGKVCACCGSRENITIDHIKPLSLGGTNYIYNLQPLCRSCNSRKKNRNCNDYRVWGDNSVR